MADLLTERLPWTLLLIATSMSLAVGVGWLAGIHSGWRRGRAADQGLLTLFLGLHSLPVFFVGSMAVSVLSVKLGWFPLGGVRTPFLADASLGYRLCDIAYHLALPAAVLAANFVTSQYLNMRATALAVHTFLRGRDPRAAVFSVQMLGAGGGDTHDEAEYRQWLSEAGYRSVDVVHLARPPESIVFAAP